MTNLKNNPNEKRKELERIYNNSFDKLEDIIHRQEELIQDIISKHDINPDDLYV